MSSAGAVDAAVITETRTTVAPAILPTRPADMAAGTGDWWVLHTRSRNEKRVADALRQRGVSCYLPLRKTKHAYAKSVARFEVPLFPCYVFLHGDPSACEAARRTNRVAHILPVQDQDQLTNELVQIDRALSSGSAISVFSHIQPGRRYRVAAGPLKDIEGVVIRQGRRFQVCLDVTMLGQSAAIEVDADLLLPMD